MTDDSQNTVSGTSGGAPLTVDNGNWFLSSLSGLANVGAQIVGVYSSFMESGEVAHLAETQQVNKPQQSMPISQVSNAADFFSDPARIQNAAMYALAAVVAVGSVVYIAKKV